MPTQTRAAICHGNQQELGHTFDIIGIDTVFQHVFELLPPKGTWGVAGASAPEEMLEFNESSSSGGGKTVMAILGGNSTQPNILTANAGTTLNFATITSLFPSPSIPTWCGTCATTLCRFNITGLVFWMMFIRSSIITGTPPPSRQQPPRER